MKITSQLCLNACIQVISDMMEQFANNFSLISKEKKGRKCKTMHKEEIMTNDVVLIVLSNKGIEDATPCNEEEDDKMRIMKKKDIQEFKDTQMMY